jgi:hypothetical protein
LQTDQLIRGLVADLPTSSGSVAKTIALSLLLSVVFSLAAMFLWLGPRPELSEAVRSAPFWIKAGYTFAVGTGGLFALERLGRPGASARQFFIFVAVVVAFLAIAASVDFAMTAPPSRSAVWLGGSSSFCPWGIAVLSVPLLLAGFAALRKLAPTRFALAGTAAGVMAGGYGACIYSLHCAEYGMPFLATWYTLGMLMIAAAGAGLSRLLRW